MAAHDQQVRAQLVHHLTDDFSCVSHRDLHVHLDLIQFAENESSSKVEEHEQFSWILQPYVAIILADVPGFLRDRISEVSAVHVQCGGHIFCKGSPYKRNNAERSSPLLQPEDQESDHASYLFLELEDRVRNPLGYRTRGVLFHFLYTEGTHSSFCHDDTGRELVPVPFNAE